MIMIKLVKSQGKDCTVQFVLGSGLRLGSTVPKTITINPPK